MRVSNHRLSDDEGNDLDFRRTPNQSSGTMEPVYLVMHYTAGSSAAGSISWLLNPDAQASAHLVIAKDGTVTQLAAFNRKTWHAGRSEWEGRTGLNNCSIGIELDNSGKLEGGPGNWRSWLGTKIADDDVVTAAHKFDGVERGWERYDPRLMESAIRVGTMLVKRYGLKDVIGHDDIAPGRKSDPGPAFPMASYRSIVMGRGDDDPATHETTTILNIRGGPGTEFDKLEASPLPAGTKLEVLSSHGVWREVDVRDTVNGDMDVSGWVHGRFIRRI